MASLAIALSGLLGATAVPFTTYLSAYLTNEIGRPEAVSSAVWQVLGITGALSGLCIGSFADRYDYRKIIAVIFWRSPWPAPSFPSHPVPPTSRWPASDTASR